MHDCLQGCGVMVMYGVQTCGVEREESERTGGAPCDMGKSTV